jgi:hypothetical protein
VRLLKLVLLVAGALGGIGFFLPFVHDGDRSISARDALTRVEEDWTLCDRPLTRGLYLPPDECKHTVYGQDQPVGPAPTHRSYLPFYFVGPAVMLVVAAIALVRRRLGGLLALCALPASLVAIGGPLRELRVHHDLGWGAALLAISGVVGLIVAIAGVGWSEPEPPKPPPEIPEARVVTTA